MTESERLAKRERFLKHAELRKVRRPQSLQSLPELATMVKEEIARHCPRCSPEIVSTSPGYVEDTDAMIEVWDVPHSELRRLIEHVTGYLSPMEAKNHVTIVVICHAEGESSGIYGLPHPSLRPQDVGRTARLATA